jgi:hypothetical protein
MARKPAATKACKQCGQEYPTTLDYFASNGYRNGVQALKATCRECYRQSRWVSADKQRPELRAPEFRTNQPVLAMNRLNRYQRQRVLRKVLLIIWRRCLQIDHEWKRLTKQAEAA